jgi:hypothetical protein
MALVGVTIGIGSALGLTRLMANQLCGVSAHDPLTFAGVVMLLIIVGRRCVLHPRTSGDTRRPHDRSAIRIILP